VNISSTNENECFTTLFDSVKVCRAGECLGSWDEFLDETCPSGRLSCSTCCSAAIHATSLAKAANYLPMTWRTRRTWCRPPEATNVNNYVMISVTYG